MGYVEYDSNNSGGHWWLKDEDWKALEAAGWKVVWHWLTPDYDASGNDVSDSDGTPKLVLKSESTSQYVWDKDAKPGDRWLGALASHAYRTGLSLREAAAEWERVTSGCATDAGCACCGQPHRFTEYDDKGKYVASGPDASYVASW